MSLILSNKAGNPKVEIEKNEVEKEVEMSFDRPGEYEVGGVGMVGLKIENKVIFVLHVEGVTVTYLGDFAGEFNEKQLDEIGPVDIMLAGDNSLKIVKALNPSIVVPVGDLKKIAEMTEKIGVEAERQDKLVVSKEDLPEDTSVVMLG